MHAHAAGVAQDLDRAANGHERRERGRPAPHADRDVRGEEREEDAHEEDVGGQVWAVAVDAPAVGAELGGAVRVGAEVDEGGLADGGEVGVEFFAAIHFGG